MHFKNLFAPNDVGFVNRNLSVESSRAHQREQVEALAQELLKKEVLFMADLERLIGKRQWEIKQPPVIEPPKEEVEDKKTETVTEPTQQTKIEWNTKLEPPMA